MAGIAPAELKLPSVKALQTIEQMELLDIIDSLRAHGLGDITALPQLIVCGDQSSGKSSVLEAISGIPFPRKENLCTRFATEVILRRQSTESILVSIVSGTDRTNDDKARLENFEHKLLTPAGFPRLFELAMGEMGLSSQGGSFSKDILRVEFRGPSQPQLTLVDLPGFIHSATDSQTNNDVKIVRDLVNSYLDNPRSIILAVVSAKNDIGCQIVLNQARRVDPQGKRTLGIITKPDMLPENSSQEEAFLRLARNENVNFDLGWHVVRNIDSATGDLQQTNRDNEETSFFEKSNFKALPQSSVGIATLRTRLSKVLFDQIRFELPRLVNDIDTRVSSTKAALDKLGPERCNIHEQRKFLHELSESFQLICRDAIRGDYEDPFFQGDLGGEKRLCATVMNKHFEFAENLREKGAKWTISDTKTLDPSTRSRDEAIQEACEILKRNRGRELPGLPNPLLVGELFREYSEPWAGLAKEHIRAISEITKTFLSLVLQHLTDPDVTEKLLYLWLIPKMDQKMSNAFSKLNELLEVHQEHPMTTNHHFIDSRKKVQQNASREAVEERLKVEFAQPNQKLTANDIARIMSTMDLPVKPDMDLIAAEDAFDNMKAFYDVAMKLFMDNVPTLAIHAPIIRDLPKIFCPTVSYSMDKEIVKKIAGESEEKTRRRDEIKRRLTILETGARICKQYAIRQIPIPQTTMRPTEQFSDPITDFLADSDQPTFPPEAHKPYPNVPKISPTAQYPLPKFTNALNSPPLSNGTDILSEGTSASMGLGTTPAFSGGHSALLPPNLFSPYGSGTNKTAFGSNSTHNRKIAKGFSFSPSRATHAQNRTSGNGLFASSPPLPSELLVGSPSLSPLPPTPSKSPQTTQRPSPAAEDPTVVPTTFQDFHKYTRMTQRLPVDDHLLHIAARDQFREYSQEELRLADYESGHKVCIVPPTTDSEA